MAPVPLLTRGGPRTSTATPPNSPMGAPRLAKAAEKTTTAHAPPQALSPQPAPILIRQPIGTKTLSAALRRRFRCPAVSLLGSMSPSKLAVTHAWL